MTTEWLTSAEGAAYLKVEPRTLLDWARTGKVKGYTLSGAKRHVWRFRLNDLRAILVPSSACSADKGAE
jgi:hypothetical protein